MTARGPQWRVLPVALVLWGTVLGAAGPGTGPGEGTRADEYRVKAAFLFNFAKFIEWPSSSFSGTTTPLQVCVLGVDPFGWTLDDTLRGRAVAGRPIQVRRMTEPDRSCHLLFISTSERKRLPLITEQLRGASILTVGEDDGFIAAGGMIELISDGDNVQFNVSPLAAERAGLHVSARLVSLAANQRHASGGRR